MISYLIIQLPAGTESMEQSCHNITAIKQNIKKHFISLCVTSKHHLLA